MDRAPEKKNILHTKTSNLALSLNIGYNDKSSHHSAIWIKIVFSSTTCSLSQHTQTKNFTMKEGHEKSGLFKQRLNVIRKLRLYRGGKPECSVMTLGGSFTRGEWYQISWWDPLGGQPVVPILPLSQLPATHWVSTWIQTHESPCSALLLCIFSHYNLLFRHMRCHPDFKRNLLGAASCWHCWCWC